jgi:hypothetical protein
LVYQPQPACKDYPSGLGFLVIVKVGVTFTSFSDATEWATKKTAGDVVIVPINGGLAEASPNEDVGFGAASSRTTGFDWSFEVMGQNLDDNLDFLDRLNKAVNGEYSVIMVTWKDLIGYAAASDVAGTVEWLPVSFTGMPIIDADRKTQRKFKITGKWSSLDMIYSTGALPRAAFV